MPRYVVERTFVDGLTIPMTSDGAAATEMVYLNNLAEQVSWVQSFVAGDRRKTFCIYDAPSPEAVRRAAIRNRLPVDRITEVRVLDPFFYY